MSKPKRKWYYLIATKNCPEIRCSKAAPVKNGWLHYEIREDGSRCIGLAKPGTWRFETGERTP